MAMQGRAVTEAIVLDTDMKLSASEAKALYSAGARTVVRYVPLPGNAPGWDLDAQELASDTEAGLVVVVIQHPRAPENNVLSAATGAGDAAHAVQYCRHIGYVQQADGIALSLGLDMEGVKNPGPSSFAHALQWVTDVLAAGYRALVYFGFASGVTSAQADELAALGSVVFWCDAGPYKDRPAPTRGYALKQEPQSTMAGVGIDRDDLLQPGVIFGLAAANDNEEPVPATDPEPHVDPSGPTNDPDATLVPTGT